MVRELSSRPAAKEPCFLKFTGSIAPKLSRDNLSIVAKSHKCSKLICIEAVIERGNILDDIESFVESDRELEWRRFVAARTNVNSPM